MGRPHIAILASGEGTTAEAVIIASAQKKVGYEVSLVIASKVEAGICKRIVDLNRKYSLGIACEIAVSDPEIQQLLERYNPAAIVLMGYMKKIGPELVHAYGWREEYTVAEQARLLNTHPGLLPATKGLYGIHVQQYVIDNELPCSGQTLHIVSENYDEGPAITQHKVPVESGDTAERLFERVKIAEKQYLPRDIADFIESRKKYND